MLFWQPGLESAQNSITSFLGISGHVVVLMWLLLTFLWALVGGLVGRSTAAGLLFYIRTRRREPAQRPVSEGNNSAAWPPPWRSVSPSGLFRNLSILFAIAIGLSVGYMVLRQLGYDSRTIQVADARTGEVRSYRLVTVLPRDAIAAIKSPNFVPATVAARWMGKGDQVSGLEIGGESRAYPIKILSRHEVVDDVVGGTHVAVTW